jgi:hypothetical protein
VSESDDESESYLITRGGGVSMRGGGVSVRGGGVSVRSGSGVVTRGGGEGGSEDSLEDTGEVLA